MIGDCKLVNLIPGLSDAVIEGAVLDLVNTGGAAPEENDGIETSLSVWIDMAARGPLLEKLPGDWRFILLRNVLHQSKDYRSLIRIAFSKLVVGGWMVITVPHQFLFERKFRLPSRYQSGALRFYTPASLLMEVEESLEPASYRLRLLRDDDTAYDYEAGIEHLPAGHKRIILGLERIARPNWADQMVRDDDPRTDFNPSQPIVRADALPIKTHLVVTQQTPLKRICVLKLDHRGDFQMAEPALQELRRLFPTAHIVLFCGPWNADAAQASSVFDEVIPFSFFAEDVSATAGPSTQSAERAFISMLNGRLFDLALDLRWFSDTRLLLRHVNASYKAGFDTQNSFPWLDIQFNVKSATHSDRIEHGFLPARDYESVVCKRRAFALDYKATKRSRWGRGEKTDESRVIWGAYCDLAPGDYEFEFLFDADQKQEMFFDIAANGGRKVLSAGTFDIGEGDYPKVAFSNPDVISRAELRFYVSGDVDLEWSFAGVRFLRKGIIMGVHQREMMQMLVNLVGFRLAFPFKDEVLLG